MPEVVPWLAMEVASLEMRRDFMEEASLEEHQSHRIKAIRFAATVIVRVEH
jgi:hypothetical protein